MADDVLLNKAAAIERSARRVREEHAGDDGNLDESAGPNQAGSLRADERMVGFHNDAVHEYQKLSLDMVRRNVGERLGDSLEFAEVLLRS